jgi:hypothetical protein
MAQDGELAKMANDTEMFKAEQENTTHGGLPTWHPTHGCQRTSDPLH